MQRTKIYLSLIPVLSGLWGGSARAQEGDSGASSDAEASDAAGDDGGVLYGKVTIAGQTSRPSSGSSGLGRMYGGVSGRAGAYGNGPGPRSDAPELHTVEKGDTLWALSEKYYGNPWAWPQVWGLNPQIENPHWIYPGDQLRTKPSAGQPQFSEDNSAGAGGMVGRKKLVPEGTVFIRNQGYIGDPKEDVWGEVVGAHEDVMLVSEGATVYVLMREGVDVRLGQRLTVYHEVSEPLKVEHSRKPPGEIVRIYGTIRVDGWDRDSRIVKGVVIESLDAIERGFSVGPVGRRFDVVPPRPAEVDVEARLLNGLQPTFLQSEHQLVFIDRGSEDGLSSGNRLRIIRRGDTWRQNLSTANHHARVRVEMGSPDVPESEVTPLHGDQDEFPDEVIGEIQVVRTEDYSSICMVMNSRDALEAGDRAVAVKGY